MRTILWFCEAVYIYFSHYKVYCRKTNLFGILKHSNCRPSGIRCLYKNLKNKKYQELCNRQNWPANAVKNCSAECASKARNVVLISAIFYLLHSLLCLKKWRFSPILAYTTGIEGRLNILRVILLN